MAGATKGGAAAKRQQPVFEYHRPAHYPKQLEAIFDCKDRNGNIARYGIIEASTKAGKTRGCIAWLAEQAWLYGKEGRNFWWVAPIYQQAKIAWSRMKRALPKGLFKAVETGLTITLITGAVIMFKSAEKPDGLYGEDVYAGVIDEASRVRTEAWYAIRSTLTATRGPLRVIGNVKGRKNWFYELARKAQHGDAGMAYAKLTAWDAVEGGVLDRAEIEDAQRLLPEQVFRELYLAEPSDDGGNPFGIKHINGCIGEMSDEPVVACGVDLAKKQDWSVITGLDHFGVLAGFERFQRDWEYTTDRVIELIGNVPTLIDATGVGDPIVERVQKKRRKAEGYIFSASSKQRLMEGLAVAIQRREITIPAGVIVDELEQFEYVYTRTGVRYSAPEGYHDDCVMSLALAVEQWRTVVRNLGGMKPGGPVRISPWLGDLANG